MNRKNLLMLLMIVALCGCERASDQRSNKPFWQSKPAISGNPDDFCEKVARGFSEIPNATNYRCQDKLANAYGARVDGHGFQVVLLQGAGNEWFMFAYETKANGKENISGKHHKSIQNSIENALSLNGVN